MAFKRRSGASFIDPASIKRRSGSSWVGVANVYRRVSGAWVLAWAAVSDMVLSANSSSANGTGTLATVTTSLDTVITVTGGNGNTISYAWTFIGISGVTALSPTSATTKFRATTMGVEEERSGTARCTVTQSGSTTKTIDISISFYRTTA